MDTTTTLALVAYALQFTLLSSWIYITNRRIEKIERAKCRCCSTGHPLLDPVNP